MRLVKFETTAGKVAYINPEFVHAVQAEDAGTAILLPAATIVVTADPATCAAQLEKGPQAVSAGFLGRTV